MLLKLFDSVTGEYHPKFSRRTFVWFCISSILYMYRETSENIVAVYFVVFGGNIVTTVLFILK